MRNVTNRILQVFILSILVSSCIIIDFDGDNDNDGKIRVEGQGDLVETEISVSDFSSISNIGVMDINVTSGSKTSVKLRAQQNLMEYITCETRGDELKLGVDDDVSISSSKGMYADIVMPNDVDNIKIIGTGNIKLAGEKQESLDISITGTGNVDAFGLEVGECNIKSTGTGNCKVFVNEKLDIYITGLGKVYYKGQPTIKQTIIGLGGVIDSN